MPGARLRSAQPGSGSAAGISASGGARSITVSWFVELPDGSRPTDPVAAEALRPAPPAAIARLHLAGPSGRQLPMASVLRTGQLVETRLEADNSWCAAIMVRSSPWLYRPDGPGAVPTGNGAPGVGGDAATMREPASAAVNCGVIRDRVQRGIEAQRGAPQRPLAVLRLLGGTWRADKRRVEVTPSTLARCAVRPLLEWDAGSGTWSRLALNNDDDVGKCSVAGTGLREAQVLCRLDNGEAARQHWAAQDAALLRRMKAAAAVAAPDGGASTSGGEGASSAGAKAAATLAARTLARQAGRAHGLLPELRKALRQQLLAADSQRRPFITGSSHEPEVRGSPDFLLCRIEKKHKETLKKPLRRPLHASRTSIRLRCCLFPIPGVRSEWRTVCLHAQVAGSQTQLECILYAPDLCGPLYRIYLQAKRQYPYTWRRRSLSDDPNGQAPQAHLMDSDDGDRYAASLVLWIAFDYYAPSPLAAMMGRVWRGNADGHKIILFLVCSVFIVARCVSWCPTCHWCRLCEQTVCSTLISAQLTAVQNHRSNLKATAFSTSPLPHHACCQPVLFQRLQAAGVQEAKAKGHRQR